MKTQRLLQLITVQLNTQLASIEDTVERIVLTDAIEAIELTRMQLDQSQEQPS